MIGMTIILNGADKEKIELENKLKQVKEESNQKIENVYYTIEDNIMFKKHNYQGIIKTINTSTFKERTLWVSNNYTTREEAENETKIRYEIICNKYLNK